MNHLRQFFTPNRNISIQVHFADGSVPVGAEPAFVFTPPLPIITAAVFWFKE